MNFDQPTYERIEAYLLDRLDPQERKAFEKALSGDPDLREELELQRTLLTGVQETALKEELKQLHRELESASGNGGGSAKPSFFRSYWAFLALAAAVAGVALLLWLFIPSQPEKKDTATGEEHAVDTLVLPPNDTLPDTATLPVSLPEEVKSPAPERPVSPSIDSADKDKEIITVPLELPETDTGSYVPETETPEEMPRPVDLPTGMVLIQGGTFQMGGGAGPSVTLDDFHLDLYEVSNQQYCDFLNAQPLETIDETLPRWLLTDPAAGSHIRADRGGFRPARGFADHPVTAVTWEGAAAFARWADKRLPTEAEWEYAARGGHLSKGFAFSGSNNPNAVAWNQLNSGNQTHPVGLKAPNEWGLYDMSGNVWEWCADYYGPLSSGDQVNPEGPARGAGRVVRGGSFRDLEGMGRQGLPPATGRSNIGFRCAKD